MSSILPSRRHGEAFQVLLEGGLRGATVTGRYAGLLALVGDLQTLAAPRPSTTFVADLRTALLTAADEVLVHLTGAAARPLPSPARRLDHAHLAHRRMAIVAGAVTLVGATASVTYAADSALPGDLLYPLKRTVEGAETGLASGAHRTEQILGDASERLDEAQKLSTSGSVEEQARVAAVLDDFRTSTTSGADRALASGDDDQVRALRAFTKASLSSLTSLEVVAPDSARTELAGAAALVTQYDARAAAACATCGGAVLDLPSVFLLTVPPQITPVEPLDPRSSAVPSPALAPQHSVPQGQSQHHQHPSSTVPGGDPTSGPTPSVVPEPRNPVGDLLDDLTDPVLPGHHQHTSGPDDGSDDGPLAPIVTPITDPLQDTVDDTLDDLGNLLPR